MKNKSLVIGILAAVSVIPLFIFNIIWSWIWFFGIGMELLNYETIPDWILCISCLPIIISPIISVFGVAYGFIRLKEKRAWLGIVLSAIGLLENCLLYYFIFYFSRF